jgi:hypothetical protein
MIWVDHLTAEATKAKKEADQAQTEATNSNVQLTAQHQVIERCNVLLTEAYNTYVCRDGTSFDSFFMAYDTQLRWAVQFSNGKQ